MEKKKLIGIIVGVIAFIALIGGATFAWFTYNITLNNAGYNFTSSNFSIVYDKGSNINCHVNSDGNSYCYVPSEGSSD